MIDVTAAATTIAAIAKVAKESGKIGLYDQIIALQQVVLEAVDENMRLAEENARLAERVREQAAEIRAMSENDGFEFDGQVYWSGEPRDLAHGPYCPKCYGSSKTKARMRDRGNGFSVCTVCESIVPNRLIDAPNLDLSREPPPQRPPTPYFGR